MTDKRYWANHLGVIFDNAVYGINVMATNEIVDRLNELHEENQELKNKCAFLEEFLKKGVQYEYYQQINDENKQLKKELDKLKNMVEHENKQLKSEIKDLNDVLARYEEKELEK